MLKKVCNESNSVNDSICDHWLTELKTEEKAVEYASGLLILAEKNYSTSEREALAAV